MECRRKTVGVPEEHYYDRDVTTRWTLVRSHSRLRLNAYLRHVVISNAQCVLFLSKVERLVRPSK